MIPEGILPDISSFEVSDLPGEDIEKYVPDPSRGGHAAYLKTGRRRPGHNLSILGTSPFLIFRSKGLQITLFGKYRADFSADPLACLSEIISRYRNSVYHPSLPACPAAAGAFSYDLKDMLEELPVLAEDAMGCPDIHFTFFKNYYIRELDSGKAFKVAINADAQPAGPPPVFSPGKIRTGELKSDFTGDEYQRAVMKVKERIIDGEIYQANISQQFSAEFSGDGFGVFRAVDSLNPAPMSAYLDCGDFRLISSSPERFLSRKGERLESRPIKGTRPRGKTPREDKRLLDELLQSEKDRAELAMIVDLVRNDIGKTAYPGSVRVPRGRFIEKYPNVFHSIALVEGRVPANACPVEIIASCFPGGSVTGCPKVQAMKVIEETEKHRRGFYCGSIGWIGYDGGFDLNIAIRTFTQTGGKLFFNLGGGIVYDSEPLPEYEETLHKGRSMFEAVKNYCL